MPNAPACQPAACSSSTRRTRSRACCSPRYRRWASCWARTATPPSRSTAAVEPPDMNTPSRHRLALVLLVITPALWAVNALIARKATGAIEPHLLAMLRWLLASGLFFLGAHTEIWAQRRQILADWHHYLILGALGMWICGAWVYIGGHTTSAANIGLIYAISPVLIVLASALWL